MRGQQRKIVKYLFAFLLLGLIGSGWYGSAITSRGAEKAQWTIGIYMCGSDLESADSSATGDILEILQAKIPDNVNLVFETGGSKHWRTAFQLEAYYQMLGLDEETAAALIPESMSDMSDYIQRYKIDYSHKEIVEGKEISCPVFVTLDGKVAKNNKKKFEDAVGMNEKAVFDDFLVYLDEEFPAEHVMIDLWNHGGGVKSGVCYDSYASEYLSTLDLIHAFSERTSNRGKKYELIGFDACLMSTYELLIALGDSADYMLASSVSEPGTGWYYSSALDALGEDVSGEKVFTGKELGNCFVDSFREYYENEEYHQKNPDMPCYLANFDLSKMALSLNDFDELMEIYIYLMEDEEGQQQLFKKLKEEGRSNSEATVGLLPFLQFSEEIARQRCEELKKSYYNSDQLLAEYYSLYEEKAKLVEGKIFSEDVITNSYLESFEENKYKCGPINFLFPMDNICKTVSMSYIMKTYPLVTFSDNYGLYIYRMAKKIDGLAREDVSAKITWDTEKEEYKITLPEKYADCQNGYGIQSYQKINDKYYLINNQMNTYAKNYVSQGAKQEVFYMGDIPLHVTEKYGCYAVSCEYTGELGTSEGEVYFYENEKGEFIIDMVYFVEGEVYWVPDPGDKLVFSTIVDDRAEYLHAVGRKEHTKQLENVYIAPENVFETGCKLPFVKKEVPQEELYMVPWVYTNLIQDGKVKIQEKTYNVAEVKAFSNATIQLPEEEYEMTGDGIEPKVTVVSGSIVYKEGVDYIVSYSNNIGKGTATVTVTGIGQYDVYEPLQKTFVITQPKVVEVEKVVEKEKIVTQEVDKEVVKIVTIPGSPTLHYAKVKGKKVVIKFKSAGKNVNYQLACKKSSKAKRVIVGTTKKCSFSSSKIKKKNYVYVRAYITVSGKKYYSNWSKAKLVA